MASQAPLTPSVIFRHAQMIPWKALSFLEILSFTFPSFSLISPFCISPPLLSAEPGEKLPASFALSPPPACGGDPISFFHDMRQDPPLRWCCYHRTTSSCELFLVLTSFHCAGPITEFGDIRVMSFPDQSARVSNTNSCHLRDHFSRTRPGRPFSIHDLGHGKVSESTSSPCFPFLTKMAKPPGLDEP